MRSALQQMSQLARAGVLGFAQRVRYASATFSKLKLF
jgi:hypothetical protein